MHDAARPLVTPELVELRRCRAGRRRTRGRRRPVTDTVKEAGPSAGVTADARPLATVGDPDAAGVPRAALERALDAADEVLAEATDDAWLVEAAAAPCASSRRPENLKVTRPIDLPRIAELLLTC